MQQDVIPGTRDENIPTQSQPQQIPVEGSEPDPELIANLSQSSIPSELDTPITENTGGEDHQKPEVTDTPATNKTENIESQPADPETVEDVGEVALGSREIPVVEPPKYEPVADDPQESEMTTSEETVNNSEDQDTPLLPPVGTPDEITPQGSLPTENNQETTPTPESQEIATKDPEIALAGDKAEKRLRDGLPEDLSPEEQSVVDKLVERVRSEAEAEALSDKEKSPEALVFKKLEAIHSKLEKAGLTEDAKLLAGQIDRLQKVVDAATEVIGDPQELRIFERSAEHVGLDDNRLDMLLGKAGASDRNMIGYVPLSIDLGRGRRQDKSGTWYDVDDIDQYNEQIEKVGGLEPVLSDEALAIVLEESGIKDVADSLESLESATDRPDLEQNFYHKDLGRGGNILLAQKTPGKQHIEYRLESTPDGRIEKKLRLRLDSGFIIDAALRRIKANQ